MWGRYWPRWCCRARPARRALKLGKTERTALLAARAAAKANATAADGVLPHPATVRRLRYPLTSFIGRGEAISELRGLLVSRRLLTLTGPGRTGTTRLALEVARMRAADSDQSSTFVDLGPLVDSSLPARAVAESLGVREEPERPLLETLAEAIGTRPLLLILDNCEHLRGTCAELVERLLGACPALRILATSRERLGVAGEQLWPVPPLSLPDAQTDPIACDAVLLFVDRARLGQAGFVLDQTITPTVVEICRRLDGIPLAIELAAARLRLVGLHQLAGRLDQQLRLPVGGTRVAPPRQHTLRATIDWSYALLDPVERQVFDRLSVFSGGWSLDATEAVCASQETTPADVLDRLCSVVDKSLVIAEERNGTLRYRLLETMRQYALEQLETSGEASQVRATHAAWFLTLAETAQGASGADGQRIPHDTG
jgi:predicted ATPase